MTLVPVETTCPFGAWRQRDRDLRGSREVIYDCRCMRAFDDGVGSVEGRRKCRRHGNLNHLIDTTVKCDYRSRLIGTLMRGHILRLLERLDKICVTCRIIGKLRNVAAATEKDCKSRIVNDRFVAANFTSCTRVALAIPEEV